MEADNNDSWSLNDNPPKILYKYRNPGNWHKLLVENMAGFPSAAKFNDPFDCRIYAKYENLTEEENVERARKYINQHYSGYSDLERENILIDCIRQGHYRDPENLERCKRSMIDANLNKGIFSLSAIPDSQLMWAHYTDSHQGICIGFNGIEMGQYFKSFHLLYNTLIPLYKINYSDKYPLLHPVNLSEFDFGITPLITKSADWNYEQEFRFINWEKADIDIKIENYLFAEVILGCNISDEHKSEVLK